MMYALSKFTGFAAGMESRPDVISKMKAASGAFRTESIGYTEIEHGRC